MVHCARSSIHTAVPSDLAISLYKSRLKATPFKLPLGTLGCARCSLWLFSILFIPSSLNWYIAPTMCLPWECSSKYNCLWDEMCLTSSPPYKSNKWVCPVRCCKARTAQSCGDHGREGCPSSSRRHRKISRKKKKGLHWQSNKQARKRGKKHAS